MTPRNPTIAPYDATGVVSQCGKRSVLPKLYFFSTYFVQQWLWFQAASLEKDFPIVSLPFIQSLCISVPKKNNFRFFQLVFSQSHLN